VLVLTMFDDDWVFAAMPAGARGYVLKGAEQQEIANHLSAIFAKLQVADRTQAVLRARDAGLGRRTS
jgi:DNA-binding NarL/FixJ family response regulator